MRHAWWLVGMMVTVGGCSAPAPGELGSGSRLRARYLVGVEGDRLFRGFHDTQLGVDCAWEGTTPPRCLPSHVEATVFEDAACRVPLVAATPDPCARPRFASVSHDLCGHQVEHLWRVGTAAVAVARTYQLDADGACRPAAADPSVSYHRSAGETPLTEFAGGRLVDEGHGRLRTRMIVGDDGSRFPAGAYDPELAAACRPDLDLGRCIPAYQSSTFTLDSACSVRAVASRLACEPAPYIAVWHDGLALWRTGALQTPAPNTVFLDLLVARTGWTCALVNVAVDPAFGIRAAGEPVGLAQLAAVERVLDPAGSRLQTWTTEADGYREFDGVHDRVLGVDCVPREVGAGAWRCLPELPVASGFPMFVDAACQQSAGPVVILDDDRTVEQALVEADDGCARAAHVHQLGPAVGSGSLYYQGGGGCRRYAWEPPLQIHRVGAEISLEPFVALTAVTE